MAYSTANCRLRWQPHYFKAGQWLRHYVIPALVVLSLLSCSTFVGSPVYASGANMRNLGRATRARLAAFFGRMRLGRQPSRTSETEHRSQQRLHRRSKSMHDLLAADPFVAAGRAQAPEDEQEATSALYSDNAGKVEVAVKAKFNLRKVHVPEKSPLHAYIPDKESLLLRHKQEGEEYTFAELRHRRFLRATPHNLWYMVTIDGTKYMLRILCAPTPKSRSNTEQIMKVISFGMDASLAVASRLSRRASIPDLVEKGIGLPLTSGTLLSVPVTYEAAGMICGKSAILYPAMRHTLKELLSKVQLSDEALLYLTRAVVRCVAEMHTKHITHNGLSTSSFRIDDRGNVYVFAEYDYTYGGWDEDDAVGDTAMVTRVSDNETAALAHVQAATGGHKSFSALEGAASAVQRASGSERKNSLARGSAWAVNEADLRQLPGTTTDGTMVHRGSSTGFAGNQVTMRPRKKSAQQRETTFTFGEHRDAFDLGDVIFQIWCGLAETRQGENIARSRTLSKPHRAVSMKNCKGNPPTEVKVLIKRLQSARHSQYAVPRDLVTTSPLFLYNGPPDSSSSTST